MGQKDRFTYEIKFTGRRGSEWTVEQNLEKPLDSLNTVLGSRPIDDDEISAGLVAARDIIVGLCAVAAGGAVAGFRIIPTHPVVHAPSGRQICCHVCHECSSELLSLTPGEEVCAVCDTIAREDMTHGAP